MEKLRVAVLFGGRAPEHEISIITGIQVLHALNKKKYIPIPIYVSKSGQWIRGDTSFFEIETFSNLGQLTKKGKKVLLTPYPSNAGTLERAGNHSILRPFLKEKIDVIFPAFHGRYGEDGAIQGLLDLADIPYVGCDVQASAIGMDKMVSKDIARSLDIPVLSARWCTKSEFGSLPTGAAKNIMANLKFPVFVKPVRLGSSIGIKKATNNAELLEALKVAFFYDSKVMVEQGLVGGKEVNISIVGNDPYEFSVCEQPLSTGELLSFKDKYLSRSGPSKGMASLKRIVPAKIKSKTELAIKDFTQRFFREIGGTGIARADYLVSYDEKEIYFNEINTMPGSLAFYLWKPEGISFMQLLDKLVTLAQRRHEEKAKLVTVFKSNVLEGFPAGKLSKA